MRIGPPRTPTERHEALACLLGVASAADRADRLREAVSLADAGEIDLSGLYAAWKGRRAVAATLFVIAPDGSAFVWPAETSAVGGQQAASLLLREVVRKIDSAGCRFAQAAVEAARADQGASLEAAGFRKLTELLFLQRPLIDPLPPPVSLDAELVAFSDQVAGRFSDAIERTYQDSRDCPGFAGIRDAADALRSYRAVGTFSPKRWRLVTLNGRDIAVILVNGRPEDRASEIVYLGVCPEARRVGWAKRLVASILHEACEAGLDSVLTSVDGTNTAAVNLYGRLGFSPIGRRHIFVRRRSGSAAFP